MGPGPAGKLPNWAPPGLSAHLWAQKNKAKKLVPDPGEDFFGFGPGGPAKTQKTSFCPLGWGRAGGRISPIFASDGAISGD